jgi:hypothetical protein
VEAAIKHLTPMKGVKCGEWVRAIDN